MRCPIVLAVLLCGACESESTKPQSESVAMPSRAAADLRPGFLAALAKELRPFEAQVGAPRIVGGALKFGSFELLPSQLEDIPESGQLHPPVAAIACEDAPPKAPACGAATAVVTGSNAAP